MSNKSVEFIGGPEDGRIVKLRPEEIELVLELPGYIDLVNDRMVNYQYQLKDGKYYFDKELITNFDEEEKEWWQ